MFQTVYTEPRCSYSQYPVVFQNEKGVRLTREFDSPYLAARFVNKLRHSKRCTLISYPIEAMR